jgi:Glyoxalase superfamily protein
MSRNLPPHPNLEHLKKQAKDLLHDMQQENPTLKLADAQHAIAREYGFASWPKLKAYIESLTVAPNPTASEKANLFAGKWTANLSKSKRHPSNQFQSAILQITVDGNTVTIIDVVVDDSGREVQGKNTIPVDGNEHMSENKYVLVARWRGAYVLETEATKDGLPVGWGTYEVSEDGQTLTISGDQQVIVLDRD